MKWQSPDSSRIIPDSAFSATVRKSVTELKDLFAKVKNPCPEGPGSVVTASQNNTIRTPSLSEPKSAGKDAVDSFRLLVAAASNQVGALSDQKQQLNGTLMPIQLHDSASLRWFRKAADI
jgi:hypothetical protein